MTENLYGFDVESEFPDRKDDGLFGPESVTWRVFAHPVSKLGGTVAMLMQAMNQNMMKLFYNATSSRAENSLFSAGREERTGMYFNTITFADTEHAEAAASQVRRMHEHAQMVHPATGEVMRADNPLWLSWTHNTFIWGLIRAMREFGPGLSDEDANVFIVEQFEAARLIGLDPNDRTLVPGDLESLNVYIDEQKSWLAIGYEAAEATMSLREKKPFVLDIEKNLMWHISHSMFYLMPEWAANMYGVNITKEIHKSADLTRKIMEKVSSKTEMDKMVHDALDGVQTHPYKKTEADRERAAAERAKVADSE